jgi:cell division control protein 6
MSSRQSQQVNYFSDVDSSIFANKTFLDTRWLPSKEFILARQDQTDRLIYHLGAVFRRQVPNSLTIYGRSGSGKTAVVRAVLTDLQQLAESKRMKLEGVYLNAHNLTTDFKLMQELQRRLCLPYSGSFISVYYDTLEEYLVGRRSVLILVLDEIDRMKYECLNRLLYSLYEVSANVLNKSGMGICLVSIANNLNFQDQLDERTRSRFFNEAVVFDPYEAPEISEILSARAAIAFRRGVCDDGIINRCAALAARAQGDSRNAIDLLRVAGEIAEKRKARMIEDQDVDEAVRVVDQAVLDGTLLNLPLHVKLALYALIKVYDDPRQEEVTLAKAFDEYATRICPANRTKPLHYRSFGYMASWLEQAGLIAKENVSAGRYGRKALIHFDLLYKRELLDSIRARLGDEFE